MYRWTLSFLLFMSFTNLSLASNVTDNPLNKVNLQLSAQMWLVAKTAKVTVQVNTLLDKQEISVINQTVLKKLNQLSDQEKWRILSFQQKKDPAGLERIEMIAEARFPRALLSQLNNKAKQISQAGMRFSIIDIAYTPSFIELAEAKAKLRQIIYEKAKQEAQMLSKEYQIPYFLHQLTIAPRYPRPLIAKAAVNYQKSINEQQPEVKRVEVDHLLNMTANVTFASKLN